MPVVSGRFSQLIARATSPAARSRHERTKDWLISQRSINTSTLGHSLPHSSTSGDDGNHGQHHNHDPFLPSQQGRGETPTDWVQQSPNNDSRSEEGSDLELSYLLGRTFRKTLTPLVDVNENGRTLGDGVCYVRDCELCEVVTRTQRLNDGGKVTGRQPYMDEREETSWVHAVVSDGSSDQDEAGKRKTDVSLSKTKMKHRIRKLFGVAPKATNGQPPTPPSPLS